MTQLNKHACVSNTSMNLFMTDGKLLTPLMNNVHTVDDTLRVTVLTFTD
jgi:hypothetical protein